MFAREELAIFRPGSSHYQTLEQQALRSLFSSQLCRIASAIEVQSIKDVPLPTNRFMIIVSFSGRQTSEALCNSLTTRRSRSLIWSPCISTTHDGSDFDQPLDP